MPPEIPGKKREKEPSVGSFGDGTSGPNDPEAIEFPAEFLPGRLGFLYGGRGRTQPQPGDQFFQAPLIPLGRDLNPSILQIPDPPAEAEGNGPAPGVVAEKNALNAARNKDMDSSFHRRERYATIAAPGP